MRARRNGTVLLLGGVLACGASSAHRHAAGPSSAIPALSTNDIGAPVGRASDAWYELTLHGAKLGYFHETTAHRADVLTLHREEVVAFTRAGAPVTFHARYEARHADDAWSGQVTTTLNGITATEPLVPASAAPACMPAVFASIWLALGHGMPACGVDAVHPSLRLDAIVTSWPAEGGGTKWRIAWRHPWGDAVTEVVGASGHPPEIIASSDGATARKTTAHLAQAAWSPPDLLALTAVKARRVDGGVLVPARHRPFSPPLAAMRFPGQQEALTADGRSVRFTLSSEPLPADALPPHRTEMATTASTLRAMIKALHARMPPSLRLAPGVGDCRALSAQLGADLARVGIAFRYATGWRLDVATSSLVRHRWLVVRTDQGWISIDPRLCRGAGEATAYWVGA